MNRRYDNIVHIRTAPMIGALGFFAIIAGGAISAEANVTTLALWRLGEDDAGAVAGSTGSDPTTAAVGFDLDRSGDPTYSSNTSGAGSAFSMAFDGTGDVYSRGEPVTTATDFFGIEAWVSVATLDTGGERRIVAFNGDPDSNGWGLVQIDDMFFARLGGSNSFATTHTLQVDRWYHVALVRDSGFSEFYLDGVNPAGANTNVPNTPTDPFLIGGNIAGTGYFEGNIDHVRVFSVDEGSFDPQTDLSLGIPEPSSLLLAAFGFVFLVAFAWRRRKEVKPPAPSCGSRFLHRRFIVASLLCSVAAFLLPLSAAATTIDVNTLLTGPGFNSGDPALGNFTDTTSNLWLQEAAALVVGAENGISPNEGDGMLRIQETGGTNSEVRQVVAVSVSSGDEAIFEMLFNSPSTGSQAGVLLTAYGPGTVGVDAINLGAQASVLLAVDANPLTWEPWSVGTFTLPDGTTQLEARAYFRNGTISQNGYVDVPEPSTLLLATLGLLGLAHCRRRKQATVSRLPIITSQAAG